MIVVALVSSSLVGAASGYSPRVPDVPRTPSWGSGREQAQATEATPRSREFFNQFQRRFDPSRSVDYIPYLLPILTLVLLVGGTVVVVILYNRHVLKYSIKDGYHSPIRLFNELCVLHGLLRSERQFLKLFAESNALPHPLSLFIEPRFFLDAGSDPRLERHRVMIEVLLIKMFGIPEDGIGGESGPWESSPWNQTHLISSLGGLQNEMEPSGEFPSRSAHPDTNLLPPPAQGNSSSHPKPRTLFQQIVDTIRSGLYQWDDAWATVHRFLGNSVSTSLRLQRRTHRAANRTNILFHSPPRRGIPLTELDR